MHFSFLSISKKTAFAAVVTVSALYPLHADAVKDTQKVLSEWISVEKQISEDRSEWMYQKEVIANSIEFMEKEVERLQEIISTAKETASAGETKRAELDEKKESLDAVTTAMKDAVVGYESQIKSLEKSWPKPFKSAIGAFLKRIPTEEQVDTAPLTVRLQNIVAILSQFDKFQGAITKDTSVQEVDGVSREVTTLYYGFAYAYFIDGSGEYAGYGYPNDSGWEWIADTDLSEDIGDMVAIYDRTVDASFISLPAKIVTP